VRKALLWVQTVAWFVAVLCASSLLCEKTAIFILFEGETMVLTPENQAEVLTRYFTDKQSIRSIAREFGVDRKTIRRVIERRSVTMARKFPGRKSQLDPFKEAIDALLQRDPRITATVIFDPMRERGYMGGYTGVKVYVRKVRGTMLRPREGFLRLEFLPGEVAQVDWGEFGDVFGDGVKIHCFAMVLAFSRMIYIEFTRSEKFEEFIRCHENAFKFFGGAPKECWYDNLTTAVADRMGGLIRFNSRFMAYMSHHGIRPHACNVARGNEKGRVEDLIKYIRSSFWAGQVFRDFDDLTQAAIIWRNQKANVREHRTTRRVVRIMFESQEKEKLLALNPVSYDTDEIFSRHVTSDFHIQYESNRYSVPWTLVGMTVTVRVNPREIKVFYHQKLICSHPRSYRKNQVITTEAHRAGLLERKPGVARESWQLSFIKNLGAPMSDYVELIRQGSRSLKNELSRLVGLTSVYGEAAVKASCEECLKLGIIGVDSVELSLKRRHHPSELQPELINFANEKLNRVPPAVDLRIYDALYFEGEQPLSASKEGERHGSGSNAIDSGPDGGSTGLKTQVLGQGSIGGSGIDEGTRGGPDYEISGAMDFKGEVGAQDANDPKPGEIGQVPPPSNGGEF
jgi:transposase